ncbi:UNVERIFIED_CONTAM: pre-rRNA processing protein [Siphonaria sp. JEL0065]|nr:pre-rRNA processing protein [Siphonaria sp. JEL0065]
MKDSFFVNKKSRGAKEKGSARSSSSDANTRKAKVNPTARRNQSQAQVGKKRPRPSNNDHDNDGNRSDGSEDALGTGDVDQMDLVGDRNRTAIDSSDEDEREDERESAAQKRLRLAKKYIEKMKGDTEELAPGEFDAQDLDNDLIAERLRDDVLQAKGKAFFKIADRFQNFDVSDASLVRTFGGKKVHQLALTCVDVVSEEQVTGAGGIFIYSASKDGHIVKWDFKTGKKVHEFLGGRKHTKKALKAFGEAKLKKHIGHRDQVLCLAISGDGKYLASGGRDKTIQIWSIPEDKHLKTFTQHRDAVSGLSFRYSTRTNQLYSSSYDRTIKLWNVDEQSYIETLFGHQDRIEAVDSLAFERCLTAGSRDRTVRLWKIVEESQLIFRGGGGGDIRTKVVEGVVLASEVAQAEKEAKRAGDDRFGSVIDVVAMLDEEHFVSGTDNGAISLWNIAKKKPLFTRAQTHGAFVKPPTTDDKDAIIPAPCNWITALAVVRYSDLFASGSCDGFIRLWKMGSEKKTFWPVLEIPMVGFINSLRFFEAPPLDKTDTASVMVVEQEEEVKEVRFGAAKKREAARKKAALVKPDNIMYLAVGTGQEHRLGRWWRAKDAKNQLKVITLG